MATPAPSHHDHAADLGACLDLVNTVELSDGVPHDGIPTVDDAVAFLTGHGLGHEEDLQRQAAREGEDWLARVRDIRAALRDAWDAQVERRAPSTATIDTLNRLLDHGPRSRLAASPDGIVVGHRHRDDDPTGEALARAAAPLVEAIAAGATDRFRVCANDGCRWVFEDASRAGRRRWCDMSTCGNRAKVRRYRDRHREDPDAPGATTASAGEAGSIDATDPTAGQPAR